MSAPSRLDEIRERLQAATPQSWEPLYDEAEDGRRFVYGVRFGSGDIEFCAGTTDGDGELFASARADLEWAVDEIDYLRRYGAALSHFAFCLDGVRWALEHPAPGRLERRGAAEEQARQALCAIPLFRKGECERGCRRTATHALVIERGEQTKRERCCPECGERRLMGRRAAIAAGLEPAAVVRLEPISQGDRA